MAASTYKCPSCGGYLAFDPESQKWKCPFCDSVFDESVVTENESAPEAPVQAESAASHQVLYRCQNCGSEIMTDETTVATNCYYCHSPVVLEGKLTSDMRPDEVLPFSIDRQQASDIFMKWVKNKRYVPDDFFKESQIEKFAGVYYPHFVSDCEVEGSVTGEGYRITSRTGTNVITTKTDVYRVERKANITFRSLMRPALTKANRKLAEGIQPYPLENAKPFSDAYLSGFLAERRDIEAESYHADLEREVQSYVEPLLTDTVSYDSKNLSGTARLKEMKSRYVLLPAWVITYPNRKNSKEPFYYAINGCTGEVCGKLPIDAKKVYMKALCLGAITFAVLAFLSYFIF